MPDVPLPGCTPEPLMNYLKALGVFRLVAEQGDKNARGHWQGETFVLESKFGRDELVTFFTGDYRPTPIVGPWGARSGFYPGSSESSARAALDAIVEAGASAPRLIPFRDTIEAIRSLLKRHGFAEKVKDEDKLQLMRICRNELPDELMGWLDAVYLLTDEGRKFPPLLGTGGNEGSGSYTSGFAQLVVELLIRRTGDTALRTTLFDEPGARLEGASVGHFNPGAVGGPNSGQGFFGRGGVNPWDYLLALEGTMLFAAASVRRFGVDTADKAAFPFAANSVAVGYASAATTDETADSSRAELWLPLWDAEITYPEIVRLFAEGRAQIGRRQARNAVEFALAACLFGVSRGVNQFVRYGFLKRNGLSYFAAPLGRVPVTPRPAARLLDDPPLTQWVDKLRSACRDKDKTPARYQAALRGIDRAMFEFANRSDQGDAADRRELVNVLAALGRAEKTLAGGLAFCRGKFVRPIQRLHPDWLLRVGQAGNDGREFRLAAALASVLAETKKGVGPMRVHLEPVEEKGAAKSPWVEWCPGSTSAVWTNRPLTDNLAAIFLRRFMESERAGIAGLSLRHRVHASLPDVLAFLSDEPGPKRDARDARLTELLWGLIGVQWSGEWFMANENRHELRRTFTVNARLVVPTEFALIRLIVEGIGLVPDGKALRVGRRDESPVLRTTPIAEPFHRLARVPNPWAALCEGTELAWRRLWADQLPVNKTYRQPVNVLDPLRLLAACLFPLRPVAKTQLVRHVITTPATVR